MAPFLSRHYLAERPGALCLIPFAGGAPDSTGTTQTHNLLALGAWSEDAQEHHLTVLDMIVGHSGGSVSAQPAMSRLAAFQHPGRVAAVQAASLGGGEVVLVAAGADGSLSRLRMTVPLTPGSQPDAIQLESEDIDGATIQPWLDMHSGPAASLDIHADQREVVSASGRGTIALSPLAAKSGEEGGPFYDCSGALTFTSCRWTTPSAFVAGSMQGMLQVWDRRQGARLAQQCRAAGHSVACLAVHPAQPHVVASGGEGGPGGSIQVWDLRQAQAPVSAVDSGPGGVRDLHFDAGSDAPQLVFCTGAGLVGAARESGRVQSIYREPTAAVQALCLGSAGACRELFAATDQEGLVFMAGVL